MITVNQNEREYTVQVKETAAVSGLTGRVRKLDIYTLAEYAARAIMGLILGRARLFGAISPFGVAFAAASPDGLRGLVTLLGVLAGSLTLGDLYISIKYIAAAMLVRATLHFFPELGSKPAKMGVTFAAMAVIGAVYVWDANWEVTQAAFYVVEVFLAAGTVYFYEVALSPMGGSEAARDLRALQSVSSLTLLGTLLMSLGSLELFGAMSVGRCLAVVVIMFAVFKGGTSTGCVAAAALGLLMDLAQSGPPFFTLSYTMCALIAGIFTREGRLVFLLVYAASGAISVLWARPWGVGAPPLYENFAASVIFMALPEELLSRLRYLLPSGASGFGFLKAREYTRDRVELCAQAFRGIYEAVRASDSQYGENIAEIFDRASDAVCRSCPMSPRCWQQEYVDTLDIMNNLTPILTERGSADLADLPERFRESCQRPERLVGAINAEARVFLTRRQYRARLRESRGAAYNQYYDISAVLASLARELGGEIEVEPALEIRLRKYLRGMAIDASIAVFRLRGGRLRAEIRSKSLYVLKRDKQYLDKLSEVLGVRLCTAEGPQDQDRLVLLEAEPLAAAVGVAGSKRAGESVSGDRSRCFRTDEGYLYVALSDGMGSGPEAAKSAEEALGVLERFLKAGVEPDVALRILSDIFLLKNETDIESATVDLLCLNMFTGEAGIFKYGAAPSYIRKNTSVRRLTGFALPVGFRSSPPLRNVYAKMRLTGGAWAVMISDGVTSGGEDKWLRELVSAHTGDASELAKSILEAASARGGLTDDATVIAVKVDSRS